MRKSFGKDIYLLFKQNAIFLNILMIISLLFVLFSLYKDFKSTKLHGSKDLRNRIVGARLFKHTTYNPYSFHWKKDTDERFVDPFDYFLDFKANRLTITPFVLWLHTLICDMPYKKIQYFWNGLMWLLLIISFLLLLNHVSIFKKKIMFVVASFMVFSAYFLRTHIDKGQIYIFYLFLFTCSYYFYQKKQNLIISSFFMGLLLASRPTAFVVLLPFILKKKYKFLFFSLIFSFVFFLIPICFDGIKIYYEYYNAMNEHSLFHLGKLNLKIENYPYKYVIDNVPNLLSDGNFPIKDSTIQAVLLKYIKLSPQLLMLLYAILMLPLLYKFFLTNFSSDDLIYFFGFSLFFISDFFLPAARLSYNNVYWLFPILIYLKEVNQENFFNVSTIFLIISFILNLFYYINENFILYADYGFLFFVLSLCFWLIKKNKILFDT